MSGFLERYGLFCLMAMAAIAYPIFRVRRAHALVTEWATTNGFEIVRREWVWFRLGPFPLASFGHQAIYYLVVRDREGKEHTCWLKLGDFFVGLLSDRIGVRWENQ